MAGAVIGVAADQAFATGNFGLLIDATAFIVAIAALESGIGDATGFSFAGVLTVTAGVVEGDIEAFAVGCLGDPRGLIVGYARALAGSIRTSGQLAVGSKFVGEGSAQGVGAPGHSAGSVVGKLAFVTERVSLAGEIAGLVVGILDRVAQGIGFAYELAACVVVVRPDVALGIGDLYRLADEVVYGLGELAFAVGDLAGVAQGVVLELGCNVGNRGGSAAGNGNVSALPCEGGDEAEGVDGVVGDTLLRQPHGFRRSGAVAFGVVFMRRFDTEFVGFFEETVVHGGVFGAGAAAIRVGGLYGVVEFVEGGNGASSLGVGAAARAVGGVDGERGLGLAVDVAADEATVAVVPSFLDAGTGRRRRVGGADVEFAPGLVVVVEVTGGGAVGFLDAGEPSGGAPGEGANPVFGVGGGLELGAFVGVGSGIAKDVGNSHEVLVGPLVFDATRRDTVASANERRVVADFGDLVAGPEPGEDGTAEVVADLFDLAGFATRAASIFDPDADVVLVAVADNATRLVVVDPVAAAFEPAVAGLGGEGEAAGHRAGRRGAVEARRGAALPGTGNQYADGLFADDGAGVEGPGVSLAFVKRAVAVDALDRGVEAVKVELEYVPVRIQLPTVVQPTPADDHRPPNDLHPQVFYRFAPHTVGLGNFGVGGTKK